MADFQQYEEQVKCMARAFAGGNEDFYEEIAQDMRLAIHQLPIRSNIKLCMAAAKCQGIDYLRTALRRNNLATPISFEDMLDAGLQLDTDGKVYNPWHKTQK